MKPTFQSTAHAYRSGSRTLPGTYYTSSDTLAEESERIFSRQWNCVGRSSTIPRPGDFIVRSIANESIIIVRDRANGLRAHFNVCRHRGTRICTASSGHFSESIQCPYHAWTYGIDGRLIGAPHMQGVPGFEKADYPLHAASVAECEGFVFVNTAPDPPAFRDVFAPMLERLARFNLSPLRVGRHVAYDVPGNWKLIFQNYSECLHCPVIHPELAAVLPYQSGANDLIEGPFLGGYMEIVAPNQSATTSGRSCGRAINPAIAGPESHRAYYYTLMPNLLLSIHPDYVNYYLLTPVAPDRTLVESEWMFHPDNDGDPAFNPGDAITFWDVTNRQDWDIVAQSQLGIASRRYAPGPYSPRESIPAAWDREYLRMMGRTGESGGA
jgi:glycine betaine catabolism A